MGCGGNQGRRPTLAGSSQGDVNASHLKSTVARRDIEQIWQFTGQNNVPAADKLVDRFDQAVQLLLEHPNAGPERSELAAGLRSYPVGVYVIFYRPVHDGIEIVRIAHGARDLAQLFKAEKD